MVNRYDVVLVNLDPTIGTECNKTRPCVVVSPNDMNLALNTVIIAPMTSTLRGWPFRPLIQGPKTKSELALDQIRTVDASRIIKILGHLSPRDELQVYNILNQMFA
jgi:mRNA interferase MazF